MRRRFFNIKNRMPYNHIKYSSSNYAIINFQSDFTNVAIVSNTYNRVKNEGILICAGNINNIYESPWEKTKLCHISLPDSVTTIGERAFSYCTSLTSVTIPDSVTSIGDSAFYDCSSLESINIPEGVTTIEWEAFSGCKSLTNVTIPDSVMTIGTRAFELCSSLTSITIPEGVTSIEFEVFRSCPNLKRVDISNLSVWCKICFTSFGSNPLCNGADLYINNELATDVVIPSDITTVNSYLFHGCTSIRSVVIPEGVVSIGGSAFRGCSSLTSITIPKSVTSIGWNAYFSCSSLTSIIIPESVTSIGEYAFSDCSNLTSVYCKATTPPALGNTSVFDNNSSGRKIYVPTESVDAYKSATNWSEYASDIVGYNF